MDTFALSTHPLPSCMCSAAPWWMSHTREERRSSGFFHICFSYQAGKLQRGSDLSWHSQYWLPHPGREKSSEPLIVTASQFSTPSTNQRVHCQFSVICHWCSGHSSHSEATLLPAKMFCIVSVQLVLLTQGKEHVSRLLSRQLRPFHILAILWLGNRQGNTGNHWLKAKQIAK